MPPEKYLRTIAELTDNGESSTTTSRLADDLGVSDPSASEAVQELEQDNMICRVPYKGFTLSPLGREKIESENDKIEKLEKVLENADIDDSTEKAVKISDVLDEKEVRKLYQNSS